MTADLGRVDIDGDYDTFPTPTGTLPECRRCGALVGDRERHSAWHNVTVDGKTLLDAINVRQRRKGRRPLR